MKVAPGAKDSWKPFGSAAALPIRGSCLPRSPPPRTRFNSTFVSQTPLAASFSLVISEFQLTAITIVIRFHKITTVIATPNGRVPPRLPDLAGGFQQTRHHSREECGFFLFSTTPHNVVKAVQGNIRGVYVTCTCAGCSASNRPICVLSRRRSEVWKTL